MMSKVDNMNNWVNVEYTGGSITLKTRDSSSEMQLVGSSCIANCGLFQKTQSIVFSLDAAKSNGLVALAVCLGSGKYVHGLVRIIRTEQGKILASFSYKSEQSGSVPNGRFFANDLGFTATSSNIDYRLLSVFWDNTAETRGTETPEKYIGTFERAGCRVITDGDVFCDFASGEATNDDLEAAVLQYKMNRDPDFLKHIAKEVVVLRRQVKTTTENLEFVKLDCQLKLTKINNLEVELGKTVKALVYIKSILSRPWMTWWKKLESIGTVFNPKHNRYVGVNLE
jgi:hypothetical protein